MMAPIVCSMLGTNQIHIQQAKNAISILGVLLNLVKSQDDKYSFELGTRLSGRKNGRTFYRVVIV